MPLENRTKPLQVLYLSLALAGLTIILMMLARWGF
jgi:hypothetical protein